MAEDRKSKRYDIDMLEDFVKSYLVSGNAYKSAIDSGFPVSVARKATQRVLKHSYVQMRINELRAMGDIENIKTNTIVTEQYIISTLKKIVDAGFKTRQLAPAVKAIQILGEHFRILSPGTGLGDSKTINQTLIQINELIPKREAK